MSQGKRLLELYEALRSKKIVKNKQDFCDYLRIDNSAFAKYTKDRYELKITSDIFRVFSKNNINLDWFLSGEGEMFLPYNNANINNQVFGDNANNNQVIGNNNIANNGSVQVVGHNLNQISASNETDEIVELIKNYATPKILQDLKSKLLKIKEISEKE